MDIMLEAHEFHSIEQNDRKRKYEKKFKEEMERKVEDWNEIFEQFEKKDVVSNAQLSFMIQQVHSLFQPSITSDIPYLNGFSEHVMKEHRLSKGLETLYDVLHVYFEFERFISAKYLPLFKKRQMLQSCLIEAKRVMQETEEKADKINLFLQGGYSFEEEWKEIKDKCTSIEQKLTLKESLLTNELEWLMAYSRYSLLEQLDYGDLFFAHHFQSVNHWEYYHRRIKDCKSVFRSFHKAISDIAHYEQKNISWFEQKWMFEKIQKIMSDAKWNCHSEHIMVKRRIEHERKVKEA